MVLLGDLRNYSPRLRSYIKEKRQSAADLYNAGLTVLEVAEQIGHSEDFTRALLQRAVGRSQIRT